MVCRSSAASRRENNGLKSFRDTKWKAKTVVGRGDVSLLCDPGSELQLGGRGETKDGEHKQEGKNNGNMYTILG